jgi:hypothetical protein
MSFASTLFLMIGRAIAFIFLAFVLIVAVVEHIDRDKNGYPISPLVNQSAPAANKVLELFKKNPLAVVTTLAADGKCTEGEKVSLLTWNSTEGCACGNDIKAFPCATAKPQKQISQQVSKTRRSHHPMLLWSEQAPQATMDQKLSGEAQAFPVSRGHNRILAATKTRRQAAPAAPTACQPINKYLTVADNFNKRTICTVPIKNWTLPLDLNKSNALVCGKGYSLCHDSKICVPTADTLVCPHIELEYHNDNAVKADIALAEILKPVKGVAFEDGFHFYNRTKRAANITSTPLLNSFVVAVDGAPCLNPNISSSPVHPLITHSNHSDACGSYNSPALYKVF